MRPRTDERLSPESAELISPTFSGLFLHYLTMTRNGTAFQNVGITPNQIATGGGESLALGNSIYDTVLNLSAPQAQYAFDQLSGEIHASAKTAMLEDSLFVRSAVNDRLRAAFDAVGASDGTVGTYVDGQPRAVAANTDGDAAWGQAFGSWGNWNSDGNAVKLDRSIGGFFIGADAPAFDTWRFGAVAGYSYTNFRAKPRQPSAMRRGRSHSSRRYAASVISKRIATARTARNSPAPGT